MSFLDGLSEQKATVTLLALIDAIGMNLNAAKLGQYGVKVTMRDFVAPDKQSGHQKNPVDDPAVKALLYWVGADDDLTTSFANAFRRHEFGNLGGNWASSKFIAKKGFSLYEALIKHGDEALIHFVNRICTKPFSRLLEEVTGKLNFVDSECSSVLYTVSLNGNHMSSYVNGGVSYTTSRSLYDDIYATCSLQKIFENPLDTMAFMMERLRLRPDNAFNTNALSVSLFTKINILSNGNRILEIPLTYDIDLSGSCIEQIARRTALNAQGPKAYQLDFDRLIPAGGTAQEYREIAKYLPEPASKRLRGLALEEALGL